MLLVKLNEDDEVVEYPYTVADVKSEFSNTLFPRTITEQDLPGNVKVVDQTSYPTYSQLTERVVEGNPVCINGKWTQQFQVISLEGMELVQSKKRYTAAVTRIVQYHLDKTAEERGYGDERTAPSVSARSYAGFESPFQQECIKYGKWASDCWQACFALQEEILSGSIPTPTDDEVISLLPPFSWD